MTPAPWTLKQHATNHQTLTGATAGLIADIHKDEDARLLAAAPDLLVALCDLLEDAVALGICESNMSGSAVAARAAISKATGAQA